MIKNVDNFFYIGKSHTVCDDFSLSKSWDSSGETITLSIVSDGCSNSKNSDIGSRMLCSDIMRVCSKVQENFENCKNTILSGLKFIFYDLMDRYGNIYGASFLDCTLLIALSNKDITEVFVFGDGSLLVDYRDHNSYRGGIEFYNFEFENNAPPYQSYRMNEERERRYLKLAPTMTVEVFSDIKENCSVRVHEQNLLSVKTFKFLHEDIYRLILCTDGVSSFSNKVTGEIKSFSDIGKELIAIKNDTGVFLQRRAKRILEDMGKENFFNQDDFSACAILYI